MARSRNIKPSIMDNEDLSELDPLTRLLFIYLWMLADRDGRLEDRPKRIAAQALAYDRTADINKMLSELQKSGFINRYVADGIACIQIINFAKHQTPHIRESASTLPGSTNLGEDKHQPRQVQSQENVRDDTHLSESLRRMVINRDGGKCLKCSVDTDLHVDHITPRALGGKTEIGNLQTLCRVCNQSKGARNTADFRKHNLGTVEHSPRSPDSGFLIPDSGFLIPDCGGGTREAQSAAASPPPIFSAEAREFIKTERPDLDAPQVWLNFCDHYPPDKCTTANWRKWVRREIRGTGVGSDLAITPATSDPDSKASIESLGLARGMGRWDQLVEPWAAYKNRVKTASMESLQ